MMKRRSTRSGFTLMEVMTASMISTLVILGSVSIFLAGMTDWAKGTKRIDADTQSRQIVRGVTTELREAMSVFVDADGQGLSYRMPQTNTFGAFITPATWDGVERRIDLTNGKLYLNDGTNSRKIGENIVTTDPETGSTYKIFDPGPGTITRSLTVQVVTKRDNPQGDDHYSRKREELYLRNIPSLTR